MNGRPFGIGARLWMWVRGIHGPHAWGEPCARCGLAGCLHYWVESVPDCVRFKRGGHDIRDKRWA